MNLKKKIFFFRRSATLEPIDILMDHQVDYIEKQISWKWCLLALSGNSTIVKLRRNDFVKYLKINVASLIDSEYDFVRVTSISYTPHVMVNVRFVYLFVSCWFSWLVYTYCLNFITCLFTFLLQFTLERKYRTYDHQILGTSCPSQ